MNVFGYPLFGGIAKLLPTLRFAMEEIDVNRGIWEETMKVETGPGAGSAGTGQYAADAGAHVGVDTDGEVSRR